jgi:hypothetical protein
MVTIVKVLPMSPAFEMRASVSMVSTSGSVGVLIGGYGCGCRLNGNGIALFGGIGLV